MRWRVILEKKFSTALSQDPEVGVKWKISASSSQGAWPARRGRGFRPHRWADRFGGTALAPFDRVVELLSRRLARTASPEHRPRPGVRPVMGRDCRDVLKSLLTERRFAFDIERAVYLTADSGGSRPRIRDDVAHQSDLISPGVPR
jgi:hypothetical protein